MAGKAKGERGERAGSGKRIHDPPKKQSNPHKAKKHFGAVNHLVVQFLLAEDRKDHRNEEREQHQGREV